MKSYNEIEQPYHKETEGIFDGYIEVSEKVDGSQFRIEIDDNGTVKCASKNMELGVDSMFKLGTDEAQKVFKNVKADPGDTIHIFAEYLPKPKHGKIPYTRIPHHYFAVFDVIIHGKFLRKEQREQFAFMCGLECVPVYYAGIVNMTNEEGAKFVEPWLKSKSFLGHQPGYDKVEGVVVKNYDKKFQVHEGHSLYDQFMFTKYVNEDYKERKSMTVPKAGKELESLIESCRTEARWQKALQHLQERGELKQHMSDVGLLVKETMNDLEEEEKETIKEQLYKLYRKQILQGSTKGIQEWYKKKLIGDLS